MKLSIPTVFGQNNMRHTTALLALLLCLSLSKLTLAADHEHEHENHADHADQADHEDSELKLSANELKEFSIEITRAKSGTIKKTQDLAGEVIVEPSRLYHVVPRVSGVVLRVYKFLGERVKTGDLLATLSSRELANAKAQFVAADSLLRLANTTLQREQKLYREKITAKSDYLAARQAQVEMSVKRKVAQQQLLALGLTKQAVQKVLKNADKDLTLYQLRAPVDGIIIGKHAVSGEVLNVNSRSFTVADLSQVWVNLTVYQQSLPFIHLDQAVSIFSRFGLDGQTLATEGIINWVSPTLDEKIRSATARVVIDNPDRHWRPGLFVNAKVTIAEIQAGVVIPLTALQTLKGETVVFIQHEDGDFEPQPVTLGDRDYQQVEILSGLKAGQMYVSQNAFTLKAQLQKGEFGEGHHH